MEEREGTHLRLNYQFSRKRCLPMSIISFHGRIFLSKNNKNTLKNASLKGNFKHKEAVCITRFYHNKTLNTEVQKQNEPNKETSNKSCQLNDFRDLLEQLYDL